MKPGTTMTSSPIAATRSVASVLDGAAAWETVRRLRKDVRPLGDSPCADDGGHGADGE